MGWKKVKLGDLYTVHNGLSKGRKFFGSGYPFLSFSTVFNNYFIPTELSDLVQSDEKEQKNYSICRGDVFVTRTSETSDELGMSCVALKDYPTATYNGFTKRMRPIENDIVLPEYIGYYMRMPSFRGEFQAFSKMTTRASLKNEDLLGLAIMLPPMAKQEKIAHILRNYDYLIENNGKQIKLLEEAAQRLYKEWFVDLRFPGYENVEVIDGIPEGWGCVTLGDVIEKITTGLNPRKNFVLGSGRNYYVTIKNMGNNNIFLDEKCDKIDDEALEKINKRSDLQVGDILFSGIGTMGSVYLVSIPTNNWNVSESIFTLRASEKITKELLYLTLLSPAMQSYCDNHAHGVAQRGIRMADLKSYPFILPSKDIMMLFTKNVGKLIEKTQNLRKQNGLLLEARDRLLPKLMSGEIEV